MFKTLFFYKVYVNVFPGILSNILKFLQMFEKILRVTDHVKSSTV